MNIKYSRPFNVTSLPASCLESSPYVPRLSRRQTAWYHGNYHGWPEGEEQREKGEDECSYKKRGGRVNKQRRSARNARQSRSTRSNVRRSPDEAESRHEAVVINRRAAARDDPDEAGVIRLLLGREEPDETLVDVICLS